jgi:hypothetical protein
MDRVCEPSLFTKRRRVGSGRVQVCAYEQPRGVQLQHMGLKLPKLSWVVDERVQEEEETIVKESGKIDELVPLEETRPETGDEEMVDVYIVDNEIVGDEVAEEHSRDVERVVIDIPDHETHPRQERIAATLNAEHLHDSHMRPILEHSEYVPGAVRNDSPGDQLEGIVVFEKTPWTPFEYLCLYCQQRGVKHSKEKTEGAMEHRGNCKHNPK